jgi:RNA polymerase sigma-70 factor (sigma-E family)
MTRTADADFERFVVAQSNPLLRFAEMLCGDRHTAEDLVQTALAKLYLSWDKVNRRESLDGYARRILVNENNSMWRRAWKRREVSTEFVPEHPTTDEYDDGQAREVWQAVQSLPPKQRSVIVLRYYEQLSEAEIAHTLGVSQGTVKSQASRALATLRKHTTFELNREEER